MDYNRAATFGVSYPGDGFLREFDERFNCGEFGSQRRAKHVRDAMDCWREVHELFERVDYEPDDARDARRTVRMALLSELSKSNR